jgi:hypothetical protein
MPISDLGEVYASTPSVRQRGASHVEAANAVVSRRTVIGTAFRIIPPGHANCA